MWRVARFQSLIKMRFPCKNLLILFVSKCIYIYLLRRWFYLECSNINILPVICICFDKLWSSASTASLTSIHRSRIFINFECRRDCFDIAYHIWSDMNNLERSVPHIFAWYKHFWFYLETIIVSNFLTKYWVTYSTQCKVVTTCFFQDLFFLLRSFYNIFI